jgi:hypothetical protein
MFQIITKFRSHSSLTKVLLFLLYVFNNVFYLSLSSSQTYVLRLHSLYTSYASKSKEFNQLLPSKHSDVDDAESEQEESKHGKAEHRPGLAARDRRDGGGRQHYPNNGEVAAQESSERTQDGGRRRAGGCCRVLVHPAHASGDEVGPNEGTQEAEELAGADAKQHEGEARGRQPTSGMSAHRRRLVDDDVRPPVHVARDVARTTKHTERRASPNARTRGNGGVEVGKDPYLPRAN